MNNIEKQIKKEFQHRQIEPSHAAWSKLSQELDKATTKTNNKLMYFKIAAVFIGLLVAASFFFKTDETKKELIESSTILVETETHTKPETRTEQPKHINEIVAVESILLEETSGKKKANSKQQIREEKLQVVNHQPQLSSKKQLVKTFSLEEIKNKKIANSKQQIKKEKLQVATNHSQLPSNNQVAKAVLISKTKNNEIASYKKTDSKTTTLKKNKAKHKISMNSSNDDIDSMLAMALKDDEVKKRPSILLKNDNLQLAVEKELPENTTKYKIFKVIKTGVKTARTFIVSNNN